MASNSGIKTLSQNKVLSNYFMYKFMKKNETKKIVWKVFVLAATMVLLSDADRRTTTNRPAGFFTSHNPSQCVFKIKTGDGIGCAAGIKPAIRPTADV